MWESPINIMEIQEPIIEQLNNEREEMVLHQIWKVGVDVNKEELIKALQYDRNQYEKGYKDGYADAVEKFARMCKEKVMQTQISRLEWFEIDEIARELKGSEENG
jgi:hypothetical protein